jgi:hypothetical protein
MRSSRNAPAAALAAVLALTAFGIQGHPILKRWVGTHEGRPLVLDFYGDTMLVVNDEYLTGYRLTDRTLTVFGDTSFTVDYWFALDRMMIETEDDVLITMAEQDLLARPMFGRWIGSGFSTGQRVELYLGRGGTARWRKVPGGAWTDGEWDRSSRTITFTWLPDSTTWIAQYDPLGSALLFEESGIDGETIVLWHTLR